jgi:cytochrome c-type biogenesis protein
MSIQLSGLALAFTAGIFSIFSPCGYALLPGYISFYLGPGSSVVKAVSGAIVCTFGLITVFSSLGLLASGFGVLLPQLIPLLNLLAGVILIVMGVATTMQVNLPYISVPLVAPHRKGHIGFYLFGAVYGLASAGCSAPIFLSILFYAISKGLVNGVLTFTAYAIGMGTPLTLTSILVAEAKEFLIKRVHRFTPWFQRVSGIILIVVGVYLLYSPIK